MVSYTSNLGFIHSLSQALTDSLRHLSVRIMLLNLIWSLSPGSWLFFNSIIFFAFIFYCKLKVTLKVTVSLVFLFIPSLPFSRICFFQFSADFKTRRHIIWSLSFQTYGTRQFLILYILCIFLCSREELKKNLTFYVPRCPLLSAQTWRSSRGAAAPPWWPAPAHTSW